jgi:hypothetical protein
MMWRIALFLAGTAVLIAGCGGATEAGFRQRMDRLIGMQKPVLVAVLGPPFREDPTGNGGVVATYNQSWSIQKGGFMGSEPQIEYVDGTTYDRHGRSRTYHETRTTSVDRWVPPYSDDRICFVTFEMNPQGRAVSYRYSGDGCVAAPSQ